MLPIRADDEKHQDLAELTRELQADAQYAAGFRKVFGGVATPDRVARALAAYQRTLVWGNSPLDRFPRREKDALAPSAR